ncbi:GIY-YIG nuclease family protein [Methylobacterium soli]|uniref:GIY-YIG nuclease family protein n=1 Tax=Methylobacterium soli TaxID=553447 RepID=UPI001AF0283B|nr:GIY-YIG nuclease family protein [Methylobacterium soli]
MPLLFNSLLHQAEIAPEDVRLLRHQDNRATKGRTPYALWRNDRSAFDLYQSIHSPGNRQVLSSRPLWASFVGTPARETLFVGLYQIRSVGPMQVDTPEPINDRILKAEEHDLYELEPDERLSDLVGKVVIEWGRGARSWAQRADRQNKDVLEVRTDFKEPAFPGHLAFVKQLSEIDVLPESWKVALGAAKGVYLLTCPKTHEVYVGSATGAGGFLNRWQEYARTGHGGNVRPKARDPADYQVCILQVAAPMQATTRSSVWRPSGSSSSRAERWASTRTSDLAKSPMPG